jgi:hypothetical protein
MFYLSKCISVISPNFIINYFFISFKLIKINFIWDLDIFFTRHIHRIAIITIFEFEVILQYINLKINFQAIIAWRFYL